MTLLEAERRKCAFLETWAAELPNLPVVWGRAEEQEPEQFGVAVAKALAHPPIAAEWCLPLVARGRARGSLGRRDRRAGSRRRRRRSRLAGALEASPPGLLAIRKIGPTPAGFPRRPGVARKRPLA